MANTVNTSLSGLTISGLASGIDTSTIIEGLTKLNQQRIDAITSRKDVVSLKLATFGGLQAKLLDLQGQITRLARSANGAFDSRTATSSDETVLKAAAGAAAQPGTYTLQVNSLARAQQLVSSGVADPTTAIKQGTVQIQVGGGTATTITIDSTNNTLQGLANAINASGTDVRATVINDGSATPYKLLLTANKTGTANTISITNNLSTGTGEVPNLTQTVAQTAADASITVGSGVGALTITSASTQVDNLIAGVSINLLKAAPGQPITLTVAADTTNARKAITDFVDSFNGIVDFIRQRTTYDTKTGEAGVLLGNIDAQILDSDLADALVRSVAGVNTKANRLNAIGISFDDAGKLTVNAAKLDQALSGQVAGVSISDIKNLFALSGSSTNAGVSFLLGGDKTRASGATPYSAVVTQAASAAQITGSTALAGTTVIDSLNKTFTVAVNGITSSTLTLDEGSYTPEQLAAAVQAKINGDSTLAGQQVSVTLDAGKLNIRSTVVGAASRVAFLSGSAIATGGPLGLDGAAAAQGTDVAGHFLVNGVIESATGFGQILSGASGNANTDGLQVRVTLTTPGTADLAVTQGVASRLSGVLNRYLDPATGRLKSVNDAFQKQVESFARTITKQNEMIEAKKQQLALKFAAMESTISRIKALSDQLSAQFAPATTSK